MISKLQMIFAAGLLMTAPMTLAQTVAAEIEDGRAEGRSVNVDQCVDGTCGAATTSVAFTQDRRYDAELVRRLMSSDTKGKPLPIGTPQTVDEN